VRGVMKSVPIAITILRCQERYVFLQRRNPPYENLWSMVGGKVLIGEHIEAAAKREVMEETGASKIQNYEYRGFVSERLVDENGTLSAHFLIFVGRADIPDFSGFHREGDLALFTLDEVEARKEEFLPSDYRMFAYFSEGVGPKPMCEAELLRDDKGYHLVYYRELSDAGR
jgi:8-oxo-dGTP pyrophosphatase MutT (NUDIX family)